MVSVEKIIGMCFSPLCTHSCMFGTFLGNCEKRRAELASSIHRSSSYPPMQPGTRATVKCAAISLCLVLLQGVKEKTKSLWSYINSQVGQSQYYCV